FLILFIIQSAFAYIYTLSLHDALPIYLVKHYRIVNKFFAGQFTVYKEILTRSNQWTLPLNSVTHYFIKDHGDLSVSFYNGAYDRSEEHTSELQSRENLVCRLLLEKKN